MEKPIDSLKGLCIVLTGLPAFYIMKKLAAKNAAAAQKAPA
jgi:hypothetical protein